MKKLSVLTTLTILFAALAVPSLKAAVDGNPWPLPPSASSVDGNPWPLPPASLANASLGSNHSIDGNPWPLPPAV